VQTVALQRDAPRSSGQRDRAGADTGCSLRSALADHRFGELNPQECVWQVMCDNWISNRVFNTNETAAKAGASWQGSYGAASAPYAETGRKGSDQ
jgi:hypothetical protein